MRKLTKAQVDDLEYKLSVHIDDVMADLRDAIMDEVKNTLHLWLHQTVDEDSTNQNYQESAYEIPNTLEPRS